MNDEIQKLCEKFEELIEKDGEESKLSGKSFVLINRFLLDMSCEGLYKIPDKYLNGTYFKI